MGRHTPATPKPPRSLQLDPYTLDWLNKPHREHARTIVTSVWKALGDHDRAGRDTTALRTLLLQHQPTFFRGRCTGLDCRITPSGIWSSAAYFPCVIWREARIALGLQRRSWPRPLLPLRIPSPGE